MTENVVQLPGYTVTRSQVEPHTQFILNLEHQVRLFIYVIVVGDRTLPRLWGSSSLSVHKTEVLMKTRKVSLKLREVTAVCARLFRSKVCM